MSWNIVRKERKRRRMNWLFESFFFYKILYKTKNMYINMNKVVGVQMHFYKNQFISVDILDLYILMLIIYINCLKINKIKNQKYK